MGREKEHVEGSVHNYKVYYFSVKRNGKIQIYCFFTTANCKNSYSSLCKKNVLSFRIGYNLVKEAQALKNLKNNLNLRVCYMLSLSKNNLTQFTQFFTLIELVAWKCCVILLFLQVKPILQVRPICFFSGNKSHSYTRSH